jgi:hypothetical protein
LDEKLDNLLGKMYSDAKSQLNLINTETMDIIEERILNGTASEEDHRVRVCLFLKGFRPSKGFSDSPDETEEKS